MELLKCVVKRAPYALQVHGFWFGSVLPSKFNALPIAANALWDFWFF